MDQVEMSREKDLLYHRYFCFYLLILLACVLIFISSTNVSAAPPDVVVQDTAPLYVNESSPPVCVLNLTMTDDDNASLLNITVTVDNISAGFNPNFDLAPLSGDNQSGLMIYEETNAMTGFQDNDSPLYIFPSGWTGSGPWYAEFSGINHTLPNITTGSNYYIVIRTRFSISNDEQFIVGIETNAILTDQGTIPPFPQWSKVITSDTLYPVPTVNAMGENATVNVGEWLNITASILGDDATSVRLNLSEFNGLSGAEPMTYDSQSKLWYYNITALDEGSVDTGGSGYYFQVSAIDKVGKNAFNGSFTIPIDTVLPTNFVLVSQESTPGGVGTWVNITVTTSPDTMSVEGDLAAFSGQGTKVSFFNYGPLWFYNFTILPGSLDGLGFINITVADDAGNSNFNNSQYANVDEEVPVLDVTIFQKSSPAGIGDWINITVTTQPDVIYVDADLSQAGFTGQFDNQTFINLGGGLWFYNLTVISGSFSGTSLIDIKALDDINQFGRNNTVSASWDEVAPTFSALVSQQSTPAGIGNWINITVSASPDVMQVEGDLQNFSGQGSSVVFVFSGADWYYNFTVSQGSLEGFAVFGITVWDLAGNSNSNGSYSAEVDEVRPSVNVFITQGSIPAGIGEWINITVNTDLDVANVFADLATGGFTGQMDNQPLVWSGSFWFFEFFVSSGSFEGTSTINVEAVDLVGNIGINSTESATWDEKAPSVNVIITQESTIAGIGEWINITVATDPDVTNVYADLAAAGFTGQMDSQPLIWTTSFWYYEFFVSAGSFEGTSTINVEAFDLAGNVGINNTESATWDEKVPSVDIFITQESSIAGIGEWINITVTTDLDVGSVSVDLGTAGFTGQVDDQPLIFSGTFWYYEFLVSVGNYEGSANIYVKAVDLAGNLGFNNTESATWDERAPSVDVIITQESIPAGIGDWINVTVLTDLDVASVTADLATAGFSNQVDDQPLLDLGGGIWYYNFTITSGFFEGSSTIKIDAVDMAGNSGINGTENATWDDAPPFIEITISQESTPAGIGDWVNITVIASPDVTSILADLASAGFSGQMNDQSLMNLPGGDWYYNFTIAAGSWEGSGGIIIEAFDIAGNSAINISQNVSWDEKISQIVVTILQESYPAGIGDWIYISVSTDVDVVSVDVDLFTAGFSNQVDDQLLVDIGGGNWFYEFNITSGSFDGSNTINIEAVDGAGNTISSSNKSVSWDETIPGSVITISQSSTPAKVGDAINITVFADPDVLSVTADLASSGFTGQIDGQSLSFSGTYWFYEFIVLEGSFDGSNSINVNIVDDAGNTAQNTSEIVSWDETFPGYSIIITQSSEPAKIGDTINITVFADPDVVLVTADLASSGFSNQVDGQSFTNFGSVWIYEFTVSGGTFDGSNTILIEISDDAQNMVSNISKSVSWDEVLPSSSITITQTTTPAKVGDVINITVMADLDVLQVKADMASSGFSDQVDGQPLLWSGSFWFYEFEIVEGTFDGSGSITIELIDDAQNIVVSTSESIFWDEIFPTSTITITQTSTPARIGDLINIMVNTDSDVVQVTADLASAGFSNQVNGQPLLWSGSFWYYEFFVGAGTFDGIGTLNVNVMDDAGNLVSNFRTVNFDEIYPEPVSVSVITQVPGSTHAKLGDWINITVDVGTNTDIVSMVLDSPGIFSSEPIVRSFGNVWYLNTTIPVGTADGLSQFIVTVVDDAGNQNNTKFVNLDVDNVPPTPIDIVFKQSETPARIGDWINISIDLSDHRDIESIMIDAEGIFVSQPITASSQDIWYLNTTIPEGTANGAVDFTVTVTDDSGNSISISNSVEVVNIPPPPGGIPTDEVFPWALVLILACAAVVGVGATVVAATEIGHYTIFFFIYLMYTRIKKEYILDNFTRGRIYGYIEANPGEHFNAIKRALDLKNGSLAYHLRTLEKGEFIVAKRDRGYTRFYPKSMKLPEKNIRELIPVQRNIMGIVTDNPGISQREIADKLEISYQLVHYHIKVLQDSEYLFLKKDKKQTYCYDSEDFSESEEAVEA
jgi:predicted transcriptional regulator